MKSICIKITNPKTTEYLLKKLNNIRLDEVCFSCKKFKIYENVIVHFKGSNEKLFFKKMSNILSLVIIDLYEENIIKKLINSEYFYFDKFEQNQISDITFEDLYDNEESLYSKKERINMLCKDFYEYLFSNRSIVLIGFITFRIKNYLELLLEQIDKSVNKFIVEKEYSEFISLLKMYINSEISSCNMVHLVYNNSKPILLDENKNLIKQDDDIFSAKYLSDITFSSNDYALNTLLNLVPKKIHIHLIDNGCDEFINTLKLIFEDRVEFCDSCSICELYKKASVIQK